MSKSYKEGSFMVKGFAKPLGIGIVLGTLGCILLLVAFALTASGMDIPPIAVLPLATIAAAFGSWVSGFISAKISGKNGWLMGALSSILLFCISLIAGLSLFKEFNTSFVFAKFFIMLACGIVGGMMAVNSGKRKHR